MESTSIRLNKSLAHALGVSRREADNLIASGSVMINNERATLGARFMPKDIVSVNGKTLSFLHESIYLAFNKPTGYVCSRKEQGDAPTIYSLIPSEYHALKPVGRLDKDSSGILLLTNDGDYAHQMTHPKFAKQKTYEVSLDNELAPLHQQMISDYGIELADGPSKLMLERLSDDDRRGWKVLMHEGRNRQIRRTFAALGYTVTALHRIQFGPYALGDIQPGMYKLITISQ